MRKLDQKAIAEKFREYVNLFENATDDDKIDAILDAIENLAASTWLSHHVDAMYEMIER